MQSGIIPRHQFTLRALVTALLLAALVVAGLMLAPSAAAQGPAGTLVVQTVSGGPIYVIEGSGSQLRYLTTGIDPTLSPDGQWVAFTRWDTTQHGAFGSLWVIRVDGSDEQVVSEAQVGGLRQPKSPAWSPDGSQIVISMQEGGRLQPERQCGQGLPSDPLLADEDGDYFRVVLEDGQVQLCYTLLPHPFWGLRLVEVATGAFEDLPRDRFSYAPGWDPVNDWHLVYDGERGLVNLDLNQGTTWALTDDVNDHTPVFSPDGRRIAVSYWQHDHWEVHVMKADGSGRARLTQTPLSVIVEQRIRGEAQHAWNNAAPAWSPDGSQIAFLTDRTGRWEVWVMAADGSDPHPLLAEELQAQLNLEYHGVDERVISWQ
jgi:dipeptidyl aminopeptidase/acylaminoacyl peptidase